MHIKNLWIIMPVYNEEEAIPSVLDEWKPVLDQSGVPYTLCVLNDGSKDNTLRILQSYEARFPQLRIIDKPNSGHGQTCIYGYKLAMSEGADWIFQIDSDGQCDPKFFPVVVEAAKEHRVVYGLRVKRDDGLQRVIVSRFVTLFSFVATGQWIKDGNVPYRLMHRDILKNIVDKVPTDFHLANILVSVLCNKQERIKWVPIHFRDRSGGSPSVKTFSFVKHGFKLFKQLKAATR